MIISSTSSPLNSSRALSHSTQTSRWWASLTWKPTRCNNFKTNLKTWISTKIDKTCPIRHCLHIWIIKWIGSSLSSQTKLWASLSSLWAISETNLVHRINPQRTRRTCKLIIFCSSLFNRTSSHNHSHNLPTSPNIIMILIRHCEHITWMTIRTTKDFMNSSLSQFFRVDLRTSLTSGRGLTLWSGLTCSKFKRKVSLKYWPIGQCYL